MSDDNAVPGSVASNAASAVTSDVARDVESNVTSNVATKVAGWTPTHSYIIAVLCLLLGAAGGYIGRGLSNRAIKGASAVPSLSATASPTGQMPPAVPGQMPSPAAVAPPDQMTPQDLQNALAQQLPPLRMQLKKDPNNPDLLANVGNLYFDAHQYREATTYYARALKIKPLNARVRTDMGNAYFFLGDADRAITEFNTALKTDPNLAIALFDLGIVEWRGKKDMNAAMVAWQKLLDTNPNFEGKEMVVRMMAMGKKQAGGQPGTKSDKPAM
jgi:cytochrome c-type biogenesis protein CcmH/NrfG